MEWNRPLPDTSHELILVFLVHPILLVTSELTFLQSPAGLFGAVNVKVVFSAPKEQPGSAEKSIQMLKIRLDALKKHKINL